MLERFYDPTSGSVELDGTNIKDYNVHHLRGLIGYVGQEPTLFGTSIKGNIQYGNPEATQEQIEAAARMANAHDFISSFPNGYDTQVGDKGKSCQMLTENLVYSISTLTLHNLLYCCLVLKALNSLEVS